VAVGGTGVGVAVGGIAEGVALGVTPVRVAVGSTGAVVASGGAWAQAATSSASSSNPVQRLNSCLMHIGPFSLRTATGLTGGSPDSLRPGSRCPKRTRDWQMVDTP